MLCPSLSLVVVLVEVLPCRCEWVVNLNGPR